MARIPIISSLLESADALLFRKKSPKPRSMTVIISAYNHPKWLERTLWGYQVQKYDRTLVEILIADDGSDERTRNLIDSYRSKLPWNIQHVWHPDEGFQKCRILNSAICQTQAEYLIFTDQDCIPRCDFLEEHYRNAERGYFFSGGYLKLSRKASESITWKDVDEGRVFDPRWLHRNQDVRSWKPLFLLRQKKLATLMNCLTTTSATWNGNTSSCWRDDALAVNGFNETMSYGGLDREFGERLSNAGLRAKQLRFSLVCAHLAHDRPYADAQQRKNNDDIRQQVRKEKIIETPHGIRQHNVPYV